MSNHIAIHCVNLQPLKENDIDVYPSFKVQREMRVDNPSLKEKNKGIRRAEKDVRCMMEEGRCKM
jgi:hypothetical protein